MGYDDSTSGVFLYDNDILQASLSEDKINYIFLYESINKNNNKTHQN